MKIEKTEERLSIVIMIITINISFLKITVVTIPQVYYFAVKLIHAHCLKHQMVLKAYLKTVVLCPVNPKSQVLLTDFFDCSGIYKSPYF